MFKDLEIFVKKLEKNPCSYSMRYFLKKCLKIVAKGPDLFLKILQKFLNYSLKKNFKKSTFWAIKYF